MRYKLVNKDIALSSNMYRLLTAIRKSTLFGLGVRRILSKNLAKLDLL